MSEREYLQDGSETYHAVWFVDGGTDKKRDRRRLDMRRSERELRLSPLDLVT